MEIRRFSFPGSAWERNGARLCLAWFHWRQSLQDMHSEAEPRNESLFTGQGETLMARLLYPLLCWDVAQGFVCGHVVGTWYQMVAPSTDRIKSLLYKRLRKDLESDPYGAMPRILEPELDVVRVEVTPAFREEDGIYPAGACIEVPVASVRGRTRWGYHECFLPLLDESFYFYHRKDYESLLRYFTVDALSRLSPKEVHRLLLPSEPWLEGIRIKFDEEASTRRVSGIPNPAEEALARVAERHPVTRAVRRRTGALPDVAWERAELVEDIVGKLAKEQANVLVVGESGVGKSAVLVEAIRKAHKLSRGWARKPLLVWKTSPRRITSGAKYLGDWQQSCEKLVQDLNATSGVLWIEDFVDLLRVGGEGAEDSVAAFLGPYLLSGQLQMVSEVTPRELESARILLPGFCEQFQTVFVEEMEKQKVRRVLEKLKVYAGRNLGIEIEERALDSAYRLLGRFVKYESFPGKAMNFFGRCISRASLAGESLVDSRMVLDTFVEKTGMPELFLRDDLLLDEEELRAWFARRIIGQDHALEKLYGVVKVFKVGLNDPGKPISTMVFAGPTGVGKTACARALADYFFGKGQKTDPLVRLDMSEFQHPIRMERLIGSGRGEPGSLVKQVRERPFCVLLLDEIEKAHESMFDSLLAVLDEGLLYDAYGRPTDFRNTIIVLTTNLGVGSGRSIGFSGESTPDFEASVRAFFRPEFFNRIDAVLAFSSLGPEHIARIARKELAELAEREGLTSRGIKLETSRKLEEVVTSLGFDPDHGARPLQRAIERLVVAALARYLLEHDQLRDCRLLLDHDGSRVVVRRG